MKKRHVVCGAAFFLANVAAGPAQTDPGLSTKPAGVTLSGERLAPEKAPVDLSRPEPEAMDFFATEEEKEFLRAAADGQVWAQARLGIIYVNTPDDNARMELGRGMLEHAASQDSPDALLELAKMALAGRGMARSPSEAFDYMRRAAELGLPEAQYELASMYANGQGASQDSEQALKWARQAATQGQPHAMHSVSVTLLRRAVNQQEIAQGLGLLEKAAAQNHRESEMILAGILTRGEFGMPKDEAKAESLLLPRAEAGDAEFQFGLASLYLYGRLFGEKREAGRKWLQQSAEGGYKSAVELLSNPEEN